MQIGDFLRDAGVTLAEFASAAGVSESAMSRYARGLRTPRPEVMRRIVAASGGRIQPNDLYRGLREVRPAVQRAAASDGAYEALDLVITDISGIARGKRVRGDYLAMAPQDGVRICSSIFALDADGENVEGTGLALSAGDPDLRARPVDSTIRPVPWAPVPTGQILLTMVEDDGRPFYGDPRNVLAGVAGRFRELGLTPCVALELEFYLVDPKADPQDRPQPVLASRRSDTARQVQAYALEDLDAYAQVFADIQAAAAAQGVPTTGEVAEYAAGQFEVNLKHVPDPLAAADHAVLFKRIVRGVARQYGLDATFMAKPWANRAGNGLHLHVSLLDGQGRNVFAGDRGRPSDALRHAIGGLQRTMAEAMAIFAPNANSFRRFQPQSYAPLSPTWGIDNRTVALRVPSGDPQALRVEHRVPGADANPYLALAAVLAGILHGLEAKADPGPPITGNAYDKTRPSLPRRWPDALLLFEASDMMRRYLGEKFCGLYSTVRRAELAKFERQVTPLEYDWYLRQV